MRPPVITITCFLFLALAASCKADSLEAPRPSGQLERVCGLEDPRPVVLARCSGDRLRAPCNTEFASACVERGAAMFHPEEFPSSGALEMPPQCGGDPLRPSCGDGFQLACAERGGQLLCSDGGACQERATCKLPTELGLFCWSSADAQQLRCSCASESSCKAMQQLCAQTSCAAGTACVEGRGTGCQEP